MRQIYPLDGPGRPPDLAALYAYPPGPGAWVRANMVASVDGAATTGGRSGGLSGEADRAVFGVLRALADVVLVGAGTVRAEAYRPARVPERWAGLRAGRPPSPVIAVVSRSLDVGSGRPLLDDAPEHARTIVITANGAPPDRKAAVARDADLIIAGHDRVNLRAAIGALAAKGYRRVLAEGGPRLLGQIAEAGLLDELCLTISPLLAGSGPGRIIHDPGVLADGNRAPLRPLALAHVLEDQGYLLCRYLRPTAGA